VLKTTCEGHLLHHCSNITNHKSIQLEWNIMDRTLESGASIIEISIAILIIALTGIIIMMFTKTTFSTYRDARVIEEANIVAADMLSQLSATAIPQSSGADTLVVDQQRYIRTWALTDTGYIKRALVIVEYQSARGTKEIRFTGAIN
jgi:hypothetical protein